MPESLPTVDRRPIPTVAIIGNDTVLAAAPATPVQLSHACIRRGFAIAVPASWGDELVAAETVRRLVSKEQGPAVMCVCPFVRSRLLAPGPDLAPFLVSLVAPPVAAARYLRAAYGEHGVHITYIGGCPSADDPAIDARLTPDAFLADIAEHGISLSEQPLVFDSIVPPDRRRWCSLPGGVPIAEVLWSDTDTRTLIEIDREDASTDLAQHIITREHVLLDLAPGLGCVCSGAITSVPARSARVAVTALEPPRALAPVIDPAAVVSLDAPLADSHAGRRGTPGHVVSEAELMQKRLDEVLGAQVTQPAVERELEAELDAEVAAEIAPSRRVEESPDDDRVDAVSRPDVPAATIDEPRHASRAEEPTVEPQAAGAGESYELATHAPPTVPRTPEGSAIVRRRTPAPTPARHPRSAIPKATASDGRALPRAYVAKRRTPSGVMPVIPEPARADEQSPTKRAPSVQPIATTAAEPSSERTDTPSVITSSPNAPAMTDPATQSPAPTSRPAVDNTLRAERNPRAGTVAVPIPTPGGLTILLAALLALGLFVLQSVR